MRHEDTPEESAFRAEARAWLEAHAPPRTGTEADFGGGLRGTSPEAERAFFERCRQWQRTLAEGGWAAIPWPPEYGGRGGTPGQAMIFDEEMARFDVTSGFLRATIDLVGPALLQHGTREQCRRYLPPLLRGDEVWCQLFSEPEAGSDLAALRMRAEREGDHFVLTGQKLWTTMAQFCDYGILLARTNPDVPKHRGITFLLVDMRSPGVEVRPLVTISGGRHFNEVFLTDVRVPVENVVGEIDGGWPVARTVLMHESMSMGSATHGARDSELLIGIARERGLASDPLVRQRLARVWIHERVLDLFRERLQEAIRAGRMPDLDGSVTKIFWAESRAEKDELAVDLLGAEGLLDGSDAREDGLWQEQLLDRFMATIGGGTVEVHRNGIGERALGLPREPRVDRDVPFRDLKVSGAAPEGR